MCRFTEKRGSTAVFLMMIMAALSGVVIVFIYAAERSAVDSMSQSYINLASRSVLSEFNIPLKENYGIFATSLQEDDISKRLSYYLNRNFPDEGYIKMQLESMETDVSQYPLAAVDNFKKQVIEAGEFVIGKNTSKAKSVAEVETDNRELRNEVILNNLPSNGASSGFFNIALIAGEPSTIKEIIRGASEQVITNEYILYYFKYGDGANIDKSTFFQKEAEYILYGRKSDLANSKKLKFDFVALRTILNLAHIKSDAAKMEGLLTAASIMTPGPEAVVTQLVLAGIWAGLEAENDWDLINNGHGVAFLKKRSDWALDISAISEDYKRKGYIMPENKSDFTYEDYLRIFLYFEKEEIKYLRMLDLIQINMIGRTDRNFLVKEQYVGFKVEAVINGKRYDYDEIY